MLTALIVGTVVAVVVCCVVVYVLATNEGGSHSTGEPPRLTSKAHNGTHRKPTSATRVMAQAAMYTVLIAA